MRKWMCASWYGWRTSWRSAIWGNLPLIQSEWRLALCGGTTVAKCGMAIISHCGSSPQKKSFISATPVPTSSGCSETRIDIDR